MEHEKMDIIKSILRFIREEIESNTLDLEQKESLEVAKQCLESTYEVDSNDMSVSVDAVDLNTLFNINTQVRDESRESAEDLKTLGNMCMKHCEYTDALAYYTKAIYMNPKNHVFYCNRAAAYSRLEKHWEAIADCKESIKITPTAKAYGRLGVAFSNLNMYQEAKEAYAKAHSLDPSNNTYEQNLKLAEEYLMSRGSGSAPTASAVPTSSSLSFNNFINNPALLNMASQMISDPAFLNMVSGMMSSGPNGNPNIDGFINVTQQLAQQMQAANPNLIDSLRHSMGTQNPSAPSSDDSKNDQPADKE